MARLGNLLPRIITILAVLGPTAAHAQSCRGWTEPYLNGRHGHAMAYDSARKVTVLFGGWDGTSDNGTWEWDGSAWTPRITSAPLSRYDHAMVYDSVRGVTVLF